MTENSIIYPKSGKKRDGRALQSTITNVQSADAIKIYDVYKAREKEEQKEYFKKRPCPFWVKKNN